jgi:hypothetical protein
VSSFSPASRTAECQAQNSRGPPPLPEDNSHRKRTARKRRRPLRQMERFARSRAGAWTTHPEERRAQSFPGGSRASTRLPRRSNARASSVANHWLGGVSRLPPRRSGDAACHRLRQRSSGGPEHHPRAKPATGLRWRSHPRGGPLLFSELRPGPSRQQQVLGVVRDAKARQRQIPTIG